MAPNISIREYIRELPENATEPTITIVLTSAESRFVDVRIYKAADGGEVAPEKEEILPTSRAHWAFAGTSATSLRTTPGGEQITHSVWHHWVDSRTETPETVNDEGDLFPQADGERTLERGSAVDPRTGKVTEYEECWRDVPSVAVHRGDEDEDGGKLRANVVLLLHDEEHRVKGMVVRVGQFCQGVVKVGERFALERWEWKGREMVREGDDSRARAGGWKRAVRVGDWWLPCGAALREDLLKEGGEVKHQDMAWKVVELSHF